MYAFTYFILCKSAVLLTFIWRNSVIETGLQTDIQTDRKGVKHRET